MFRTIVLFAAPFALAFGPAAGPVRADDWDDYRDRLKDLREEQRERYEDWLEDREEARRDYFDRLEDQQRRWHRRGYRGVPPAYYPGSPYYPQPFYGRWQPGYPPVGPVWLAPGTYDRSGGVFLRGPYGRGFSIRW